MNAKNFSQLPGPVACASAQRSSPEYGDNSSRGQREIRLRTRDTARHHFIHPH